MALGTETGSEPKKAQAMATASGSRSALQKELAWVLNSAPASESKSAPDSERTTAVEMARPWVESMALDLGGSSDWKSGAAKATASATRSAIEKDLSLGTESGRSSGSCSV